MSLMAMLFLLVVVGPVFSGYTWNKSNKPWQQQSQQEQHSVTIVPEFEPNLAKAYYSRAGQTVVLPCTVRNLGDKVVSWIRTRDLHILTSGPHTYTSDARFDVVHSPDSDSWNLRIRGFRESDSGKYECQVNTDPKINHAVSLKLKDDGVSQHDSPSIEWDGSGRAAASIRGPREQYVMSGSTVTFTCVISPPTTAGRPSGASGTSRSDVRWTHAGREVSFQSSRGGISVDTQYRGETSTSHLTIALVTADDAGNYTCTQADTISDTVTLLVLEGERMEAMQRDYAASASRNFGRAARALITATCLAVSSVHRVWMGS